MKKARIPFALGWIVAGLALCGLSGVFSRSLSAAAVPTIILDPGHGGSDRGVIGTHGMMEKTITLDLAERVRRLIDQRIGYRTFLTREGDRDVSLDQRAARANNQQGTLLVSIHLGGATNSGLRGYGIYLPQASEGERNPETNGFSLWDRQSIPYAGRSRRLGESIHAAFAQSFPRAVDLGIHPLALYLARAVRMPAVLVEPAVLTNPEDERFLGKEKKRQALAEAIFRGLTRYLRPERQGDGG